MKKNKKIKFNGFLLIILLVFFMAHPISSLAGYLHYSTSKKILASDDKEMKGFKVLTKDSYSDYLEAIESLKKAIWYSPKKPAYSRELSEIYAHMGRWHKLLEDIGENEVVKLKKSKTFLSHATRALEEAVRKNPSDYDNYLALAKLYFEEGGVTKKEEACVETAVFLAPQNIPLRYGVARYFLLTGRSGDAIKHASFLANLDTSYIIKDRISGKKRSRTSTSTLRTYQESYLFSAFEIAWRASNDTEVLRGILPDHPDAVEALAYFLEWRGITGSIILN